MSVNNISGLVMVENIVYFKPILSAYWAQSHKSCPKAHLSAPSVNHSHCIICTSLVPALLIPYLSITKTILIDQYGIIVKHSGEFHSLFDFR